jgi:very-short-patch-repair endonuclease
VNRHIHVHLEDNSSRLRSPSLPNPLTASDRSRVRLHWAVLRDAARGTESSVAITDALAHSLHCQAPRLAIATLDNALFLGLISPADVETIFEGAPKAVARLRRHIDGRSEAGQETIIRLLLIAAGLRFEIQVEITGVGRVDFVIEGVLVLEADSRLAHDGWELHRRDRRRDLLLAQLGYMSLRPTFEHTMFEPDLVLAAILSLLRERGVSTGTRAAPSGSSRRERRSSTAPRP